MPCKSFAFKHQPTRQSLAEVLVLRSQLLRAPAQTSFTEHFSSTSATMFWTPTTGSQIGKDSRSRLCVRMISVEFLVDHCCCHDSEKVVDPFITERTGYSSSCLMKDCA